MSHLTSFLLSWSVFQHPVTNLPSSLSVGILVSTATEDDSVAVQIGKVSFVLDVRVLRVVLNEPLLADVVDDTVLDNAIILDDVILLDDVKWAAI